MSSDLGTTQTLALLERFKGVLQDFATREEKLNSDFRVKIALETRNFDAEAKTLEGAQQERLAAAEAFNKSELERCEALYRRRKFKTNEAHKNVRRRAVEDVSAFEGRRKHKLQQAALEADRHREASLAAAATALANLQQKLADAEQSLADAKKTARSAFRGYGSFRRWLQPEHKWPEADLTPDEYQLFEEINRLPSGSLDNLKRFRRKPLPLLFSFFPLWSWIILLLAAFGASVPVLNHFGVNSVSWRSAGAVSGATFLVLLILHQIGRFTAAKAAHEIASDLARAQTLVRACYQKAEFRHQHEQTRIKQEFEDTNRRLDADFKQVLKDAISMRDQRPRQTDEKAHRINKKCEEFYKAKLANLERDRPEGSARLQQQMDAQTRALEETHQARLATIEAERETQWRALELEWTSAIQPLWNSIESLNAATRKLFPDWKGDTWQNWTPPAEFANAAQFGSLEIDVAKFAGNLPRDPRLALPCPPNFSAPLCLSFPRGGSILFETNKGGVGAEEALATMNDVIFRLLSTTPPGKLSFTIFDPVGLGQNFAGIMHLADYEASHINSRIWTQTAQFEEKLAELNDHMEKVIQMYLRNEYETIADYNAQAGSIAEKYHFLVIASFPVNFSDTAARRLRNIAASGARCGVYFLVHWDQRHSTPQDFVPDELRQNGLWLVRGERGFEFSNHRAAGTQVALEAPPSAEFATEFLHRVGQSSKDTNRVEVPFADVTPPDGQVWKEETTEELRVPIGRTGATKFQYLAIGKGTRQHALIAGKTGSGKSTLFHVIVTNLALWCSPKQVEFYLVDFKKGVEFKCYAARRLPHARVVAIESDRAFGLSVLERVDAELRRRGDLFRKLGVQDLPGYRRAGGTEEIPRSLLMIDEFQEFFTEEDRVSQSAAVLLDRIVRQGRAFGIHVILGSQTLGGAYTLARATIGQMVIRIALQCNEADAYLIMDQDNPAPRLLSRPGEGIYNDTAGSIEGNSPFQVVWLPDQVRDSFLAKARDRADENSHPYPGPFVFEGNAPSDVRDNPVLAELLKADSIKPTQSGRIWLGAPNSIKGPTEAVFLKQSAKNLLMVGQNDEASLAILAVSLISLAAQYRREVVRFILLDSIPPGSPQAEFLDRVIRAISHEILRPKGTALAETMAMLADDLKRRSGEEQSSQAPTTFLVIHGLENFKRLRQEDEFSFSSSSTEAGPSPAAVFMDLITEGPSHGFHVIASCDTYNNVSRFLGRKALSEFSMRVLFQMSAADSAALVDAPDAGTLGLHRAVFYNEREGYLEIFRPYARPGNDWIEEASRQLKRLLS